MIRISDRHDKGNIAGFRNVIVNKTQDRFWRDNISERVFAVTDKTFHTKQIRRGRIFLQRGIIDGFNDHVHVKAV